MYRRRFLELAAAFMATIAERTRDAERKRAARANERDLKIPPIANYRRRKRCKNDLFRFLSTYFPDIFYSDWTSQRRDMATAILNAAKYGGDQAIAAPRGEGKTSIAECVVIYCVFMGLVRFPLIAAATGPDAQRILSNIKSRFERNELLAADFPRECYPIQSLEGAPQRAGMQTVNGDRTYLKWAQDHIVLPTVPKSAASGAVIMTRGLDAAIRGIRVGSLRPDLVVIDDPETRESVNSETQTRNREMIIEQDLAGLGGPGKRLARVMLTTLMRRNSLSAKYTDRTQKPSWKGRRFRMVDRWPERIDLWDEYIVQRASNQQSDPPDEHARGAHEFYLAHRAEMDAGASVANAKRYVAERLPDGSQLEVSSLQHAWNVIADRGREHFDCEYQNDPPTETGPVESGITANRIMRQTSGFARQVVPPSATVLTQGIDVGKFSMHWVVRAWEPNATGYVIDYGVQNVYGTAIGSDEGIDVAITRAIVERMDAIADSPYGTPDNRKMPVDLTIIDARFRTDAVFAACRSVGLGIVPAMGCGRSAGCVQTRFNSPIRNTIDRKVGDGWFLARRRRKLWLCYMDTDRWKAWEHDRWMTPPSKPGCLFMWGHSDPQGKRLTADEKAHTGYAHQICSEVEVEEVERGILVRKWKTKRDANHWFDASYMSDVAANMKGISVLGPGARVAQQRPKKGWFDKS